MAGNLALNIQILGEFGKLTDATRGATSQLTGLSKTATSISQGMNKAFGLIGVGFSLNFIKDALNQAGKEAVADAKSMGILSTAMQNTGNATEDTVKQAETFIKKMSLQSAVADDKLRPSFQKLFISTGNVTDASKLLEVALDTSAATGKDLDTVTQAMAKSFEGSDTALGKLVPSLIGAEDPLVELEKLFKGTAKEAANLDPYQRLEVLFGEIQESVGNSLIPLLNNFADWFVKKLPEIEAFFDGLAGALNDPSVKKSISTMETSLGNLGSTIGALFGTTETDEAKGFMNFWTVLSGIVTGAANGMNALLAPISAAMGNTRPMEDYLDSLFGLIPGYTDQLNSMRNRLTPAQQASQDRMSLTQVPQNVTINVNNGNITAQEIADKINRGNRATGTNLIRNN